jgi:hypothetical protein
VKFIKEKSSRTLHSILLKLLCSFWLIGCSGYHHISSLYHPCSHIIYAEFASQVYFYCLEQVDALFYVGIFRSAYERSLILLLILMSKHLNNLSNTSSNTSSDWSDGLIWIQKDSRKSIALPLDKSTTHE